MPSLTRVCLAAASVALVLVTGCKDRPAGWQPNETASLNKTPAGFAADAKGRFPYPADLPRGGDLPVRAEIGYMWNVIHLVNYSHETWNNCEVWVNKKYVVSLDKIEPNKLIRIGFMVIYGENGQHMPEDGELIQTLELKKDGMMYDIPKQIGG